MACAASGSRIMMYAATSRTPRIWDPIRRIPAVHGSTCVVDWASVRTPVRELASHRKLVVASSPAALEDRRPMRRHLCLGMLLLAAGSCTDDDHASPLSCDVRKDSCRQ